MARFEKGKKIGPCEVSVDSLVVNYAKNSMKCTLKFEVDEVGRRYGESGMYPGYERYSLGDLLDDLAMPF